VLEIVDRLKAKGLNPGDDKDASLA
jgi:hypothetical protein